MTEEEAQQAALDAWNKQEVRHLTMGLLRSDKPLLFPADSPFYLASLGCIVSQKKGQYCRIYNETIAGLLREQGVPDWAPAARLLDRKAVLEVLDKDGAGPDSLKLEQPPYEHRLVVGLRGRWKSASAGKPSMWCRVREKGLLILAGDLSDKVGKVEILDVREKRWMASYEYLRKHVPILPWDSNRS
jgi:hypothetical protein